MQAFAAGPRAGLDPDLVAALEHADDTYIADFGADLLGLNNEVLADVSTDLRGLDAAPSIRWAGDLDIHREVTLTIARALRWDRDRLRLWVTLRSRTLRCEASYFVGVFVMHSDEQVVDDVQLLTSSPDRGAGPGSRQEYSASGLDLLHLLASPIPEAWTATTDGSQAVDGVASTAVGSELRRLLEAAGWTTRVAIAPTLATLTLPSPQSWLADGQVTWLQVLNEVLDSVAAERAWCDEEGTLQLHLLQPTDQRPVEYVADAADRRTIVGPRRSRRGDLRRVPNRWRFTAADWPTTPIEGDGIWTPPANTGIGPTSTTARGREVWSLVTLEVASQAALVEGGNAVREKDIRAAGQRVLTLGSMPRHGHRDLLELRDPALTDPVRALVTAWELHCDGSDGQVTCEEIP